MLRNLEKSLLEKIIWLAQQAIPRIIQSIGFVAIMVVIAWAAVVASINNSSKEIEREWEWYMGNTRGDSQMDWLHWLVRIGTWIYLIVGWIIGAQLSVYLIDALIHRIFHL